MSRSKVPERDVAGILRQRAKKAREEAQRAVDEGDLHRAIALRGKAVGYTQGADLIEANRA